MTSKIRILTVADIHLGIRNNIELFEKSIEFLVEQIRVLKPHHIMVLGDTFHNSLSVSHNHVKIFTKLITDIKRIRNCKLHIIEGTASHDMRQVESFMEFGKIDYYYKEATVIDLDGYKTLILPEEYKNNYLRRYSNLFDDSYDFIFGHGNIEGMIMAEPSSMTQSYIHKLSDLRKMTKKYCIFGHNHVRTYDKNNDPKVIYNSSLYRWSFEGENSPKGLHLITTNDDDTATIKFIKNPNTPKFITKSIFTFIPNIDEFVDSEFINKIDTFVEEMKAANPSVNIRINIGRNVLPQNILTTIDAVASKYNISIKAKAHKPKFNVTSEILDSIENNNDGGLSDLNSIITISNELLENNNVDNEIRNKVISEIKKILDD